MRRHQPAVKRGHTRLGRVRHTRLCVHHPSRTLTMSRGSLTTPPNPLLRSGRHASVSLGGGVGHQSTGLASLRPSRPARCDAHHPATWIGSLSRTVAGGRELYGYRISAISCSLSNLVPNSRSTRSAISFHVRPAAFISLRTASAFANERSAMPTASGWPVPNALAISLPNECWSAFGLTEAMTGAGILFTRRGRAQ